MCFSHSQVDIPKAIKTQRKPTFLPHRWYVIIYLIYNTISNLELSYFNFIFYRNGILTIKKQHPDFESQIWPSHIMAIFRSRRSPYGYAPVRVALTQTDRQVWLGRRYLRILVRLFSSTPPCWQMMLKKKKGGRRRDFKMFLVEFNTCDFSTLSSGLVDLKIAGMQ